jgi:UDP-N-acetylglucosamine 4,6-dehydratase
MNIMNLARALAPECKTEIIGIRPGEKLHEVLVPKDDARMTLEFDSYYLIQPDFRFFGHRFNNNGGKPVSEGFDYNSSNNPWKLSVDEMRQIIATL